MILNPYSILFIKVLIRFLKPFDSLLERVFLNILKRPSFPWQKFLLDFSVPFILLKSFMKKKDSLASILLRSCE